MRYFGIIFLENEKQDIPKKHANPCQKFNAIAKIKNDKQNNRITDKITAKHIKHNIEKRRLKNTNPKNTVIISGAPALNLFIL